MTEDTPTALLKKYFGHGSFRPGQERVIAILLEGRSALAIFPTGGGKSLCYQLPALGLEGMTLVVSPLIALMKDQVESLLRLGIAAARLDSTLEYAEVREIYEAMLGGNLKLVYVAPERLGNEGFLRHLRKCRLSMIAIDEAHCISEWGHNFRPDYLKLAALARDLGVNRVLALTATATPKVAADIRRQFDIAGEDHVQTPFHRENLRFLVDPCPEAEKMERLLEKIRSRPPGPTVIYVTLQRTAEEVAAGLTKEGVAARAYHAGMQDGHRAELQDLFMGGKVDIVVATIAFGMGIDKADIRYVYHFNLPKSLENYVQESGRAGRDGKGAVCEILGSRKDLVVLENFVYGDTPAPSAIKSLVEHLLMQGEQFSISVYDLSTSKDIRPLVISTALTYLEIDSIIQSCGPYYAEYKFRLVEPLHRIMAGQTEERRKLLTHLLEASSQGRTWLTANIGEVAAKIGEPADRIRQLLDELSESGDVTTQPSGLRHAYRLVPGEERNIREITRRLTELFQHREAAEIRRLGLVVDYGESQECLAGRLLGYFGDAPVRCGICSVCGGENVGRTLPSPAPMEMTGQDIEAIQQVLNQRHQALRQPRQLARFLCGLSSPATTRARLNRHDCYGMLEEIPFQEVLAYAESLPM